MAGKQGAATIYIPKKITNRVIDMRKLFLLLGCLGLFVFARLSAAVGDIVPKPSHLTVLKKESFMLEPSTVVYATPGAEPVARLWAEELQRSTGWQLTVETSRSAARKKGVCFVLTGKGKDSEAYSLKADPKSVVIRAEGVAGLFYGSRTLLQLLPPGVVGRERLSESRLAVPAVEVTDAPRFRWRGYMQDVSRTFYPVEVLKKYIDVLSLYKLNTLHLHLTDDQGWRVEIKKYPRLTSEKATQFPPEYGLPADQSGFYTQEELKDLVAYAAARQVRIVPEIDVPGHSWPVLICYPELAVNDQFFPDYVMPFRETYHVWGHQFTPNTLDPTKESVYRFLDDVFTELAAIFPCEYVHFGGDEVNHSLWEKAPHIKAIMEEKGMKSVKEVQSYFVTRVSEIIRSKGKKPVGWNDILSDAKNLPKSAHIMSWIGGSAVKDAAKYGFPTIATPSSHVYFDIRQGTPDDGLLADLSYPYAISLQKVYEYDPAAGLSKEEQAYLLGVQANMWPAVPQKVKDINVQNFPRLLALAEIAWADAEKDYAAFTRRMEPQYRRLDALKVDYYRPGGHVIAEWTPEKVSTTDYSVWTFDVTEKVYANGCAMAGLFLTKGENPLNIRKMQLLEDGKVIAEDLHRGFADRTRATGARKNYLYFLDVKNYKPGARYTLSVEVSGYRGTDSYGNVIFSLAPYEPFTKVESDKRK